MPINGTRPPRLFSSGLAVLVLQLESALPAGWSEYLLVILPAAIVVLLLGRLLMWPRRRPAPDGPLLLDFDEAPAISRPAAAAPLPRVRPVSPPPPLVPRRVREDAPTVRIDLTAGRPLEFLPGRLEIVRGVAADQEFRFHRVAGSAPAEITLGRETGPPLRHIQLAVPTVSRLHARLRFDDGVWLIENLSNVNPLCLNGMVVAAPTALEDGDEIQVGEVVLRYRDGRS